MIDGTLIEEYILQGRTVFVKREDLCCSDSPSLPPLAKLRGASILLEALRERGIKLVGNVDTAVSKSGQGVAVLCSELRMQCILGYPDGVKGVPPQLKIAQEFGAELLPLKPNYIRINYSQVSNYVQTKGGYMLPFGLSCVESVRAVAKEASTVPEELLGGTLVICTGTGTMLAGVLLGLKRLPKVIGISSGMSLKNQEKNIKVLLTEANTPLSRFSEIGEQLTLLPAIMPYSEECEVEIPFPAHKNYDAKAFKFMLDNLDTLAEPVAFWNIGA